MSMAQLWPCSALVLSLLVAGDREPQPVASPEPRVLPGVVVEKVPKRSVLEKAGLQVGDVILSWERLANPPTNPEAVSGRIETPFDWMWLEVEQAPRGAVKLVGTRQGKEVRFEVGVGVWEANWASIMVGPNFSVSVGSHDLIGCDESAPEVQQRAETRLVLCTWSRLRSASRLLTAGNWAEAKPLLARVPSPDLPPTLLALAQLYAGELYERHGDIELAQGMFARALQHAESAGHDSLLLGLIQFRLGYFDLYLRNFASAKNHYELSIQQFERLAPQSLDLARSLRDLGLTEEGFEHYDRALQLLGRSLDLATLLAPASRDVALIVNDIGVVHYSRGDLLPAEARFELAVSLKRELAANDITVAGTYNNLGLVRFERGDYEGAEQCYREALRIIEKSSDTDIRLREALETVFVNLARVLAYQENFAAAEFYLGQAENSFGRKPDGNLNYALLLKNVGNLALFQGNLIRAQRYYEKALAIEEAKAPGGRGMASCLQGLGGLNIQRKDFSAADLFLKEALRYWQGVNPESLSAADILYNLGNLESQRGRHVKAREYWLKSLALRFKLTPYSEEEAKLLYLLGKDAFRRGDLEGAMSYLARAVESMESQFDQLDNDDVAGGRYRYKRSETYRLAARVAVVRGEDAEVFLLSERYRAKGFLDLLAGRVMTFTPDLPERVDLERQRIGILLRRNEHSLAELASASDRHKLDELLEERRTLQAQRELGNLTTREIAPRLASLERPKPLTVDAAAAALDPGTAMIAYFDCGEQWYVMFLGMEGGRTKYRLLRLRNVPRQQLRILVHTLANMSPAGRSEKFRARRIAQLSRSLYRGLLGPVEGLIAPYSRLLILPDGLLHYLPWGALLRDYQEDGTRKQQYLAEWKPFHIALSSTVAAEWKKSRRPAGTGAATGSGPPVLDLVAFGDPVYPSQLDKNQPETIVDPRVRSAARRGLLDLAPLPWSRREVEGIAALFPAGHAKVFVGAAATEEEAKRVGRNARILHFATHARVDDRFPLNTALALTIPDEFSEGRENGLLQVWEIFEKLRIDADLVVLSGCETALGEEQGGEGLIGLTRAFQYAGARTVVASLWSVQDQATSELMIRFYKHLRAGLPKDEALRQAQIELIRGPIEVTDEKGETIRLDATAPYFWAGFQVYGDWQ